MKPERRELEKGLTPAADDSPIEFLSELATSTDEE